MIKHSFLVCGISNALDGSDDMFFRSESHQKKMSKELSDLFMGNDDDDDDDDFDGFDNDMSRLDDVFDEEDDIPLAKLGQICDETLVTRL